MSQFNLLDLCRLCLDKDRVSIPIFEGEGLVKKLFMKIGACLPVKVSESDRLPKKICDDCIYKVELVYSFWNTTANAEKQLLALLGEADSEPQVPLLDDSVKTENEVGMSVRMEESNISSNKSLPGQAVSKIALTNPTVIGGNVSSLSASMEMTNSTGSRLGNDLSNQSREDDSDEEESDVDDDATYSEEEDDPAAIGDGESSFNTVEPTFVNVDHMGDEAGPSGLQHEMEVENMEGEMPVEPSAAQPDEWETEDIKPDLFKLSLFVRTDVGRSDRVGGGGSNGDDNEPSRRRSRRIVEKSALFPHVEIREDLSQSSASSSAPPPPSKDSPTDGFACKVCNKSFLNSRSLKQHAIVHSEDRPFECGRCAKTYKRQYELSIHERKHHPNAERLKCVLCDYSTIYRGALDQHLKRHTQEYRYRCETCGKGFYVRKWLIEHQNVHTGEKPFKCDECDKSFTCNRYMIAHKKTSHPDGSVPPKVYQCDTCGSVFAHRNSLRLHNKMHTGENVFICDICGKVLTSKDHLKLHRRIHTGEKPYACSYCEKAFSKKHTLTQHERVHTGERPYTCDQCGKSFSQRSTLVIHLRYHSGQRPYVCPRCDKAFVCTALLNAHLKNELC